MSPEAATRCREWLEEQLESLRGLRNGNPRDAQFKIWRQTTLTVLQRIWPGDSTRSDRFRRIRFSAPQSKVDPRSAADWFARGCDDATLYLELWVAEIERDGVPADASPAYHDGGDAEGLAEEAYPTLELGAPGSSGGRGIEIPEENDIVLDLGGGAPTSASAAPAREETSGAPPRLPASSSRVLPRPATGKAPRAAGKSPSPKPTEPRRETPAAAERPAAPRPAETPRPKPARRGGPKSRLKDLLGLDAVIARVNDEPTGEPESAGAPVAPMNAAPPAEAPPPAIAVNESPSSPAPAAPVEFVAAATNVSPASAEPVPLAAATPHAEPAPIASADEPAAGSDEGEAPSAEAIEEATQRFMETSPVLSLTGRPVQRRTDTTRFEQPDAVAVATLAEDVGRLGVPGMRREAVRAQLVELAQQLEAGEPGWELLAEVVCEAMTHRALAQRLMPVLLPWLTRAA